MDTVYGTVETGVEPRELSSSTLVETMLDSDDVDRETSLGTVDKGMETVKDYDAVPSYPGG